MNIRIVLWVTIFFFTASLIIGCSFADDDYRSGVWWLEEENNWQMAAKAFRRSLDKNPKRWKSHKMMLEALGRGDDAAAMESQLKETLNIFPDSARSISVVGPGTTLIGEERFNKLASSIELHHVGQLLAKKGDRPELMARAVMASCRIRDTALVTDYYQRMLTACQKVGIPDSVELEMNFSIGSARVEWIRYDWHITRNPDDHKARLAQLDVGLFTGDSAATRRKLTELALRMPEAAADPGLAKRFGMLLGIDPFGARQLADGWDGAFSPDGKHLIFIKERGKEGEPDVYIYRSAADGAEETPLLKARQQFLMSLALPRYSPDGRWIYFYGSPDANWKPGDAGRFHLYRVKPVYGARPEKLTDVGVLPIIPCFEKQGTLLIVRRDIGSTRASVEVVRLNPDSRTSQTLSRIGEPVSGATFSPNGDSLLFTTDRGLFSRAVEGGNIVVNLARSGLGFPLLSPDGQWLLISNPYGLLLYSRTDHQPTFIGSAPPLGFFTPGGSLLITRVSGGENRVVRLNIEAAALSVDRFLKALSL